MLKTSMRQNGNVTIVDLSGRITLGESSGSLRQTLNDLIQRGHRRILLNLAEVSSIDSAGLGELIASYTRLTNQGGKMRLVKLQKQVDGVMQITKLCTIFESYENEPIAVLSLE